MPFKDTKEGETHSYNDGCGEPAHNHKLPKEIEERFDKECEHEWDDCCAHGEGQFCCLDIEHNRNKQLKSFIATILNEERNKTITKIKNLKCTERKIHVFGNYEASNYNEKTLANAVLEEVIINLIKEDK